MPEIDTSSCMGCAQCLEVCPAGALDMGAEHVAVVDAGACVGCGECLRFPCPGEAIMEKGV